MPARKSIKIKLFVMVLIIFIASVLFYQHKQHQLAQIQYYLSSNHLLAINPINYPCQKIIASNQSWWAWLKGESPSSYFHFLDLIELLHSKGL